MKKLILTLLFLLVPNILFAEIINFPIKKANKIYLLDGRTVELSITNIDATVNGIINNVASNYFTKLEIQNNYATTASVALKANVLDVYNKTQIDGLLLNLDNLYPSSSSVLLKANNLSDINNATIARSNLGLGTAATKNTGIAEGEVPILNSEGKLSSTVIPALSLTNSYSVADTSELLTLDVETGAITIVTNESKTYILHEQPFSDFANWWEIVSPKGGVTSVNTKVGAVTLDKTDIGLGNVLNSEQMTTLHPANTITGLGSGSATTVARTDDPSILAVPNKADKTYVDTTVENHINSLYQHGLPSPAGNAGKFVKSNGSIYELETISATGSTTSIELKSEIATNTGDNTNYDLAGNYTANTLQILVNGLFYDSSLYNLSVVSDKTRITFNSTLYASDEVSILRVYGAVANPEDLANYYNKIQSDATLEAYIASLNLANKAYVNGTDEANIASINLLTNNLNSAEVAFLLQCARFAAVNSSGKLSGGTFTHDGVGGVNYTTMEVALKNADSQTAPLEYFTIPAGNIPAASLTAGNVYYAYIDYNGGNPQVLVTNDRSTIRTTNQFDVQRFYKDAVTVYIGAEGFNAYNFPRREHERTFARGVGERFSGAEIAEKSERYLTITASTWYSGTSRVTKAASDSQIDGFEHYYSYNATADTWEDHIATYPNQIDNTKYNNTSTGALVDLDNNEYGVHWIYIGGSSKMSVVFGHGSYKLSDALSTQPPATLPVYLEQFGELVGRVIIQKSAATFQTVDSAFIVPFVPTEYNHNDLLARDAADAHPASSIAVSGTAETTFGSNILQTALDYIAENYIKTSTVTSLLSGKISTIYDTDDVAGSTGTSITLKGSSDISVTRTGDTFEIDYTGTSSGGISQIYANTDAEGSIGPNITLKQGSNVTITRTGDTFEISATGGSVVGGSGTYNAWNILEYPVYMTDTDTITIVDNATTAVYLKAGLPFKFNHSTVSYYAIINSVTDSGDTLTVDLCGAPFTISLNENTCYVGTAEKVKQLNFAINGYFADAAESTLLANDMFTYYKWDLPTAYLCKTSIRVKTLDSGAANSRVNVTLGTTDVLTSNTNLGLTVSNAWVNNATGEVNVTNYVADYGDTVEIKVDDYSTNKDARDLSVQLNFVMQ
ncbi:MAG TPA: hypothetical protein PKI46_00020 [Bacteroidales bacterium]|nr:hypothetical protein [Bacteroidales bacterium]